MRKPSIAFCDMLDKGWDVHLHAGGPHYAVKADGSSLKFRRQGKFRLDAVVVLLEDGDMCEPCFAGPGKRPPEP